MKKKTLNSTLPNWKLYHLLFWIAIFFTFFLSGPDLARCDFWWYCLDMLIGMIVVALLIYGNYYYLLKIYRKNKLLYILAALVSLIAFSYLYNLFTFSSCDVKGEKISFARNDTLWGYFSRAITGFRYLVISSLLKFVEDWYKQEKKLNQIKIDKLATELNYLRAQINPHFLFNTLNNLYGLALKKSEKTPEVILLLSEIMDYMLYESNDLKVPLTKDIQNLWNYIELERIRQGNNAVIEISITGDPLNYSIVPVLLLPLTENAFKHGANKVIKNGFVSVSIEIRNTVLLFTVKNNTSGTGSSEIQGHGVGLANLKKRLDLFYPGKYSLTINETPAVYSAELKLNLSDI